MNLLRTMRLTHRYVGYFVAGLMLVYALTGLLLCFVPRLCCRVVIQ